MRVSWPFGNGFESVMISSISSEGEPPGARLSVLVFGAATGESRLIKNCFLNVVVIKLLIDQPVA